MITRAPGPSAHALLLAAVAATVAACTPAKPNFGDGGAQRHDGSIDGGVDAAREDAGDAGRPDDPDADVRADGGDAGGFDAGDGPDDAGPGCPPGTGDCDGSPDNGCETDLTSDEAHCGTCEIACAATRSCLDSVCRAATITRVELAPTHSCAALSTGHVMCWGADDFGQLGDCIVGSPDRHEPAPVTDPGGAAVTDAHTVASGGTASCAIRGPDRVVDCWGLNNPTRFGPEGSAASAYGCPEALQLVTPVAADTVSMAGGHTCMLAGGSVQCAGLNNAMQLGRPTGTSRTALAAPVVGLPAIAPAQVAPGGTSATGFTLVLLSNGEVYCFGANTNFECAMTGSPVTTPTRIPGLTDVVEVTAGIAFGCALTGAGQVLCWGYNTGGQTGTGSAGSARVTVPTPVAGAALPAFEHIVAGGAFVLALAAGGTEVWGWGDNNGQFGLGPTMVDDLVAPTRLLADASATFMIAPGNQHACVVRRRVGMRDELLCAGSNSYGELGRPAGATLRTFEPVPDFP